ncbi:unnamed protein product [Mucor hiemalis]
MAKVNGVSTFSCLYTLLNEYEEICLQVLGHNKKIDHLQPQFFDMMKTYEKLGMHLPELFYTDNVIGDESFLKSVIPSLTKDVVPVTRNNTSTGSLSQSDQQFDALNEINLPANVDVKVLSDPQQIEAACKTILEKGDSGVAYVGFGCEWSRRSAISLIQISYETEVLLLRVHRFTSIDFPQALRSLIESGGIFGKNIKGDFTRIERAFDVNASGYIDIGTFCCERELVMTSNPRLEVLCGYVLDARLPKDPKVRCSDWELEVLSQQQIKYAALDAWVSLKIYLKAASSPVVNQKLGENSAPGTFVAIYNKTSERKLSSGYGVLMESSVEERIRNRKNIVTVEVIEVLIQNTLVENQAQNDQTNTSENSPLSLRLLGTPPFTIAIYRNCLRTASGVQYDKRKEVTAQATEIDISSVTEDEPVSIENDTASLPTVPFRILKDAFHIMQMIKVSLKLGMAKEFSRRFRDAIFVVDPEDKARVEEYFGTINTAWSTQMVKNSDFRRAQK